MNYAYFQFLLKLNTKYNTSKQQYQRKKYKLIQFSRKRINFIRIWIDPPEDDNAEILTIIKLQKSGFTNYLGRQLTHII